MQGYLPACGAHKESPIAGIPVVPDGTWYAGHWHLFQEPDLQKFLKQTCIDYADESGRCTFFMGPTTPTLSVTSCEDIQMLLKVSSHRDVLPTTRMHAEKFFGSLNLHVLTGSKWKSKREKILKALCDPSFQENNYIAFGKAAKTLRQSLLQKEIESVKDVSQLMKMLVFDAFGHALLSKDFDCCRRLKPSHFMMDYMFLTSEVTRRTQTNFFNPSSHIYVLPTPANQRLQDVKTQMDDRMYELVEERRVVLESTTSMDETAPQDLVASVVGKMMTDIDRLDEDEDEELQQLLIDLVKGIMFAGYEKLSSTLTYVLYLLSKHPEAERQCLEEIQSGVDHPVYLEAVIKETLRLYPPVICTTRTLEREVRFGGITVPEKTTLFIPIWVVQRDAEHFPDPLKFLPERWASYDGTRRCWKQRHYKYGDEDISGVQGGNHRALLAFSAGGRSCAGQRFAMQEITILMSVLLPSFKFVTPPDYILQPQREGFIQFPKDGIPMEIYKRRER